MDCHSFICATTVSVECCAVVAAPMLAFVVVKISAGHRFPLSLPDLQNIETVVDRYFSADIFLILYEYPDLVYIIWS